MKWSDYLFRPTSLLFRNQDFVTKDEWLTSVNRRGLIRYPGTDGPADDSPGLEGQLELELGAFFCPDSEVSWEILQVAGILLKAEKLDVGHCLFAAKRFGGEVYFRWFLYVLGKSEDENPIPDVDFPLHKSRWNKIKSGDPRLPCKTVSTS